ncbi:hypothetical protein [Phaffia rhodozyma]|uniref:Uncharacterized protein n=1 Tax=Phaffia rhodozyma TaxID=264483 RepID=A0A0F7SIZ4_PHARH|nr:hypothetical protein [Phaffia rhodozyma]
MLVAQPHHSTSSISHRYAQSLHISPIPSTKPNGVNRQPERYIPPVPEVPLSEQSFKLQEALRAFRPLSGKYAEVSYKDAFNWEDIQLDEDIEGEWYCVAFRSKRNRLVINDEALYTADSLAHEEAKKGGGLLMYWYGVPDIITGVNLATCIWESRAHARAANSRPEHIKAMRLAAQSYEMYTLERHVIWKISGEKRISIEPYVE